MVGALKVTKPWTEFLTGQVKTSPSGILWVPPQVTAGMPLMEKVRSVPGPLIWTWSVRSMSALSAFMPGSMRE